MNSMIRQHHLRIPDVKAYLRTFERNKPLSPDEWAVKESSLYEPGYLLFCLEPVAAPAGLSSFSKRGEEQGETFRVKDMGVVVSKDDGKCVAVIVTPSAYEFRVLDSLLLEKAMKAILDGRDFNYLACRPTQKLESEDIKALYKMGSEYAKGGSRRTLAVEGASMQEPAIALIGQLGAKLGTQVGKQLIDIGSICHMIFTPEGRQEDKSKAILKSCFIPVRSDDDPSAPSKTPPSGETPLYSIDPLADVAHLQTNYSSDAGSIDLTGLAPEPPQQLNYESPLQAPLPLANEPSSSFGDFGMGLLSALAPPQPAPSPGAYEGLPDSARLPELPSLPFGGGSAGMPPLTNSSETLPPTRPTASYTGMSAMDDVLGSNPATAPATGNGHGKGGVAPWYVMSHEASGAAPQTGPSAFLSSAAAPAQPAPIIQPISSTTAAPAVSALSSIPAIPTMPAAAAEPPAQPTQQQQPIPAPALPAAAAPEETAVVQAPKEDFSNQFMNDYQQGHAGSAAVEGAEKEFEQERKINAEKERGKEQRLREYFGEEHFQKYVKGEISEPDMDKVDAWQLDPSHYHAEPAEEGPNFDSDIFANAGRSTLETNPEAIVHEAPREEITGPPPDPSWSIPSILEPPGALKGDSAFDEMISAVGELAIPEKTRPLEEPTGLGQEPGAVPNLGILDALHSGPDAPAPAASSSTFAPPEPKELGPLAVPAETEPQPNSLFNRLTGELSKEPAGTINPADPRTSQSNIAAAQQQESAPTQAEESSRSAFAPPVTPLPAAAPPASAQILQPVITQPVAETAPTTYNWAPPNNSAPAESSVITSGADWPAIPASESLFAAPIEDLDQINVNPNLAQNESAPRQLHPTWNTAAEAQPTSQPEPEPAAEYRPETISEPMAANVASAAEVADVADVAGVADVSSNTLPESTSQTESPMQPEQAVEPVGSDFSAPASEYAPSSSLSSDTSSTSGTFSTAPQSRNESEAEAEALDIADTYTFPDAAETAEASDAAASASDAAQQPRVRPRDYSSPLRAPKNLGRSEPLSPLIPPHSTLNQQSHSTTSQPAVEQPTAPAAKFGSAPDPLADAKAPAPAPATAPLNPLADVPPISASIPAYAPASTSSTTQANAVSSAAPVESAPEAPVTAAPWSATKHLADAPTAQPASSFSDNAASEDSASSKSSTASTSSTTSVPATPLPFRPKPAASTSSDNLPAMTAPQAPTGAASGSQDSRLMMNEMASLMAKLEMQVAKAANKLASRAEELRGRLSQQVDTMVKEAQEVEKQSESNLSTLASEFKTKLDNLSTEVQSSLAKDSKNAEISVEEMAQLAWDKLEREQTQLTQEITRSTEEFRKDLAKLTSIVNGRLDGLIDTRNKELASLSDSILAQLRESHDAYSTLVSQRYDRFEQRMNEETSSISNSLERNMKSMVEEIETSLDRACEKLKSTRFELEQTVAHTIAMSEMAIAQKAKNLLTESILPRLNEQKEIMRTMISDMAKQIKDESISSLDAEVAKLEQSTVHTTEKLRKVAAECVEEVESTGRGIKIGLEDHFKRASGDLLVRTREVGDKIRETERRMADSEYALKGLAEASTVDSEPELNEERNHAVSKLASLKLEASKQLSNTIEQNLDGLDSKGEMLFSELSNKRSELTSQVRDAAESNLHKIRQTLQEATNAIRSAQEKYME